MSTQKQVFISDLHLGNGDQADDFSRSAGRAYERMRSLFSNDIHWCIGDLFDDGDDLAPVLRKHKNTISRMCLSPRLFILTGNHDSDLSWMRGFGFSVYGIEVKQMLGGRPTLLTHGHQFDYFNKPGASIGKNITRFISFLERHVHEDTDLVLKKMRRFVTNSLEHYEKAIAARAKKLGCDQAIYGHTHRPSIKIVDGVIVANCGTWTHDFNGKGYPIIVCDNGLALKYIQADGSMLYGGIG